MCGRQIVSYPQTDNQTIYTKSPIHFIGDQYCCQDCSQSLDDNGNFPEEY